MSACNCGFMAFFLFGRFRTTFATRSAMVTLIVSVSICHLVSKRRFRIHRGTVDAARLLESLPVEQRRLRPELAAIVQLQADHHRGEPDRSADALDDGHTELLHEPVRLDM